MTNDPIAPGSISRRRFLGTTLAALSAGIASKKGLACGAQLDAEPEDEPGSHAGRTGDGVAGLQPAGSYALSA